MPHDRFSHSRDAEQSPDRRGDLRWFDAGDPDRSGSLDEDLLRLTGGFYDRSYVPLPRLIQE